YIGYYSKGFYTRWEAEKNELALEETGFKHPKGAASYLYGEPEYFNSAWCWATDSTSESRIDSVLWGPNYKQLKEYKTNLVQNSWVEYSANYRLALSYDTTQYAGTDTVCILKIIYRYKWYVDENNNGYIMDTLAQSYLKVSQFPLNAFKSFPVVYQYSLWPNTDDLGKFPEEMYSGGDTTFIDDIQQTGIEFHLEWYGVGKLYIDYVDVYDNVIGTRIVNFPSIVREELIEYANSYSSWDPIEYWYVNDEPQTMDSYEPMRIVDSIITNNSTFTKPIITEIYPHWRGLVNGDPHLKTFVELSKPKQLMMINTHLLWDTQ
ncbi:MAG: hypothetical protein DRQ13_09180, partial [Ignavibacteriae bacterium]